MRVIYFSVVLVIIDQITKFFVKGISIPSLNINLEGMRYGQSFDVIGSFFRITFVENPGMAFGIDVGSDSKLLLSLFSLVAAVGIVYYLYRVRNEKFILRIALAMVLAGAIGNLIDRMFYGLIYGYAPLFYGKVVDFFNVDFFDFSLFGHTYDRWPIFNIADASVTIGVVLLVIFHRSVTEGAAESDDELPVENADSLPAAGEVGSVSDLTANDKSKFDLDDSADKREIDKENRAEGNGEFTDGKKIQI